MISSRKVHVIDSHTGGEPTRVVVSGGPALGDGPLSKRLARFRSDFDDFRSAIVNEPRGSDAVVGALLCQPHDPACSAGVIFFNNVGYLGMCGHGTIGLAVTLAYSGKLTPGVHRIETPVGIVEAYLHNDYEVTITNVPSYRLWKGARVFVDGLGEVQGDVAWGGNWFFLTDISPCALALKNLEQLTDFAWNVRRALAASRITGTNEQEIDHIEIFAPAETRGCDSKNFVLCPGKSYDRSPCGTGTSAKLACLYADGKITEGQIWRQQSIVGSIFEGSVHIKDRLIYPTIKGSAWITAESQLILNPHDPVCSGIRIGK